MSPLEIFYKFGKLVNNIQDGRKDIPHKTDIKEGRVVWEYSYFNEYLLALARGEKFLEQITNYPQVIKLNGIWHEALENQRKHSEGGFEKKSVISANTEQRKLYIQVVPATGEESSIPYEVRIRQEKKAEKKVGADVHLGGVHLHPHVINWQYGLSRGKFKYTPFFSAEDLFLLVGHQHYVLTGIVEGEENFFAFRSWESRENDKLSYLPRNKRYDQDTFAEFWHRQSYKKYKKGKKASPQGSERLYDIDRLNLNFDIAMKHNLVLYRGKAEGNLIRIYPPISQTHEG